MSRARHAHYLVLDGLLVAVHIEAEVGADQQARAAAGAAGQQLGVGNAKRRCARSTSASTRRRAGGDAQLAALAALHVDRHRPPALHGRHAVRASCSCGASQKGATSAESASKPARKAFSLSSTCCWRYAGTDSRMASTSESIRTSPVSLA